MRKPVIYSFRKSTGMMDFNNKNFKLFSIFFVIIVFICEILSSEVLRPRGVSLSRASLYIPGADFTCFDGSKKIPFSQVNDDYCDCPDASDEPGTSACAHGSFYCSNSGHKPLNIGSSRVNDGICDCCDGSDEYASGKQCVNNCLELGKEAREEAQRMADLIKAGKEIKADLIQRGSKMKQDKKEQLVELEKNKEEAQRIKIEKDALMAEAQDLENAALEKYRKIEDEIKQRKAEIAAAKSRAEAVETFNKFDSNQDGRVDLAELQTRATFDQDNNGEVSEEEAKHFLGSYESVDEAEFVEFAWPLIQPHLVAESGIFKAPEKKDGGEEADLEEAEEADEQHEVEDDEVAEEEPHHEEEGETEEETPIEYDEETQKLVANANAAREASSEADKHIRDIENEIKNIQEYLEKDFGVDEEFATLIGQCFEYLDHEYIYKLCPFKNIVQIPKSSSLDTKLGNWGHWSGAEGNLYSAMTYDRGQSCWNGPQRTTEVKISCGSENKVISVSEPNRCEYLFEFTTPAACRDLFTDQHELHDEL